MEVQAQFPSSAALFTPNYPRKVPRLAGDGGEPSLGVTVAGAWLPQQQQQVFPNGATVFSGEPESELTSNLAAGSRKRRAAPDGDAAGAVLQIERLQQEQRRIELVRREVAAVKAAVSADVGIRLSDSPMASTSGRPPVGDPAPAVSPLMEQLALQFYCQRLEIDAFIRQQNEKIRSGMDEAWKRHCRALLSVMEQGVLYRLREKEAELELASRRNAELEEKIRQLASENQIWFNVARSKEAAASSLRATLEQVLLQNAAGVGDPVTAARDGGEEEEEGYGETDWAAPAEDAQSCCHEGGSSPATGAGAPAELRLRSACRVCREREASALLLPCRHLCVCQQCDAGVTACPVCNAAKNASLQVFMC